MLVAVLGCEVLFVIRVGLVSLLFVFWVYVFFDVCSVVVMWCCLLCCSVLFSALRCDIVIRVCLVLFLVELFVELFVVVVVVVVGC